MKEKNRKDYEIEREQLLSIFDSINEVAYVTDPETYEILYVNKFFTDLLGGKDTVGSLCYKEFQGLSAPCEFCTNHIILKDGKPHRWEYYNPKVDRTFMITDRIIKWPDGRDVRFELAIDISERKKTEEKLSRQNLLVEGINRIFQKALICETDRDVAKTCLSVAEEVTGSKFGFIGEVNEKGLFDTIVQSDPGWDACRIGKTDAVKLIKDMEIRGLWGKVIKEEKSFICKDPSSHPDRQGTPKGHPLLKSFLGVPLKEGERTFGMIALANKEKGYTEEDRSIIEKLSLSFTEALKRKRAEIELETYKEQLEELVSERTEDLENSNYELGERMKELNCLYEISRLSADPEFTEEEMFQKVADLIPPSFQLPNFTSARFVFKKRVFESPEFKESDCKISSIIKIFGKETGIIEVYYTGDKDKIRGSEPFIKEEQDLIDALAIKISKTVERKRTEEILRSTEEEQRLLLKNLPQKIFHKDINLKYIYCNENYAKDFNFREEEIFDKTDYDLYSSELAEKYSKEEEDIIKSGKLIEREEEHIKEEQKLFLHIIKLPVKDEDGNVTGILGILWDITERKVAEEKLKETLEDLARSNRELEQFAYVASHDLQEPLRKVASFTNLLNKRYKDKLDEKASKYMWYIVDGAKRMQTLINDLFLYSRAGRGAVLHDPADLNEIFETLKSDIRYVISKNTAEVTSDSLPVVKGSSVQLQQLLQNLILNGIKFQNEEKPKIHVSAEKKKGKWIISVKDNGIGIEKEYSERIFGIFQRLHTKDKYPGTGIGLSICKKIVERHGGHIWVESEPGKGSVFYFSIPV